MTKTDDLAHRPPNSHPLKLSPRPVLPSQNLRQGIAPADAVEKAEGIAYVAFTAGVGAYDYGKWAKA